MTNADALRVIAMLTAYFRQDLSDETAALWSNELLRYDVRDGIEAAKLLGAHRKFMPSLAEFVEGIRECVRDRDATRPALVETFNAMAPEEVKAALRPYWDKVGADREASARVREAADRGDTEAKIAAAREVARRKIEGTTVVTEGRERPAAVPEDERVTTTACGARAGTQLVLDVDRKTWVCPNCGSPVTEGCDWRRAV